MTDKIVICRQTKNNSIVPIMELTPEELELIRFSLKPKAEFQDELRFNRLRIQRVALLKKLEAISSEGLSKEKEVHG